jgi:hypothetical protein
MESLINDLKKFWIHTIESYKLSTYLGKSMRISLEIHVNMVLNKVKP